MVDLSTHIGSVVLRNPVMPGSGTLAEGLSDVFDLGRLGAIVTKTITADVRQGTRPPRLVEYRDATLFSIGIPSKGVDYFLEHTVPFYSRFGVPLVASISADSVEEFAALAARIDVSAIAAVEANISCPNLRAHGRAFARDPQATRDVIVAMKAVTSRPVWAKLTPNVGDIASFATIAQEAGADALVVANALVAMSIDPETRRPRLGNVMGGLTGPALKPVVLRMVYQCAQVASIPVIGCGGISTWQDAIEYILAGASAVQVGTASFLTPNAMPAVIAGIEAYCERQGVRRLADLIGALQLPDAQHCLPQEVL